MVAPNLMVNQLINHVFSMLIIGFLISIAFVREDTRFSDTAAA